MLDCEMCVLQNAEYEKVFLFMDSPLLSWPLLSHVDYRYCCDCIVTADAFYKLLCIIIVNIIVDK